MRVFRERLKELRKSKNLSQKQLADVLQTSNSSICDWECGRTEPNIETVAYMAVYFDVTSDYLLGLEDETGAKTYNNFGVHNGNVNF